MQRALNHPAGAMSAAAFFKRKGSPDEARNAVERLMKFAAELERPGNLYLLVGVGRTLAERWGISEARFPRSLPASKFDVIVQVSAMTHADRLHGLRSAAYLLGQSFRLESESMGDRILDGLEPFGFGGGWHPSDTRSLSGGAFLLHLRYEQKLERFLEQKADELPAPFENATDRQKHVLKRLWPRAKVVGVVPASISEPDPHAASSVAHYLEVGLKQCPERTSHVATMKSLEQDPLWNESPLIRRGFSYRRDGREGLEFIGAAKDPIIFEKAFARMSDDAISRFVALERQASGLYFCPPWDESVARDSASDGSDLVDGLTHGPDMLDYSITTKDREYWDALMKVGIFVGTPGEQRIDPRVRSAIEAVHATLDPQNLHDLNGKLDAFERASNEVNARFRRYVTKG